MEVKNIEDIFRACCFIPENKKTADTVIGISLNDQKNNAPIELKMKTLLSKINLNFVKTEEFMQVDLIFSDNRDVKIGYVINILKQFQNMYQQIKDDSFPFFQMTILPAELKGRYTVAFSNPITYSLCADSPDEYPHIIRLLFDNEDIIILENENIDFAQIAAEVKRQADMQDFYEREEEKKQKQIAYEATRRKSSRAEVRR